MKPDEDERLFDQLDPAEAGAIVHALMNSVDALVKPELQLEPERAVPPPSPGMRALAAFAPVGVAGLVGSPTMLWRGSSSPVTLLVELFVGGAVVAALVAISAEAAASSEALDLRMQLEEIARDLSSSDGGAAASSENDWPDNTKTASAGAV